jgi:hypothetical protein
MGLALFEKWPAEQSATSDSARVLHPSFFEGWDSASTAYDLSLTPAAPSTVECTDDPIAHHFHKVRKKDGAPGSYFVSTLNDVGQPAGENSEICGGVPPLPQNELS